MNFSGFLAVGLGGLLGCWLRWLLAVLLNHLFPNLPPGTLAANFIGGLLMGCLMGLFERFQTLPPAVRLFSVVFIEVWRGVQLITVLFMASVMLPLFLPEGVNFDKLLRCLIGVALFS